MKRSPDHVSPASRDVRWAMRAAASSANEVPVKREYTKRMPPSRRSRKAPSLLRGLPGPGARSSTMRPGIVGDASAAAALAASLAGPASSVTLATKARVRRERRERRESRRSVDMMNRGWG